MHIIAITQSSKQLTVPETILPLIYKVNLVKVEYWIFNNEYLGTFSDLAL